MYFYKLDNVCNFFYIIFRNGLPASAICAFEKAEIDRVLNGPFKTQDNDMSFWKEAKNVPTPRPGKVRTCWDAIYFVVGIDSTSIT